MHTQGAGKLQEYHLDAGELMLKKEGGKRGRGEMEIKIEEKKWSDAAEARRMAREVDAWKRVLFIDLISQQLTTRVSEEENLILCN